MSKEQIGRNIPSIETSMHAFPAILSLKILTASSDSITLPSCIICWMTGTRPIKELTHQPIDI